VGRAGPGGAWEPCSHPGLLPPGQTAGPGRGPQRGGAGGGRRAAGGAAGARRNESSGVARRPPRAFPHAVLKGRLPVLLRAAPRGACGPLPAGEKGARDWKTGGGEGGRGRLQW
jgi:hypothetical protein